MRQLTCCFHCMSDADSVLPRCLQRTFYSKAFQLTVSYNTSLYTIGITAVLQMTNIDVCLEWKRQNVRRKEWKYNAFSDRQIRDDYGALGKQIMVTITTEENHRGTLKMNCDEVMERRCAGSCSQANVSLTLCNVSVGF